MFAHTTQQMDEDYFANINYSKNIECISPTIELSINFRSNGFRAKKPCYLYAEKMDFKGLIQLRLTEKVDQRRMYITTLDSSSFHKLKQDQSLHVTFAGFIENLVRLLQDCQAGKLELNLVQTSQVNGAMNDMPFNAESDVHDYQIQFIEMRSFKNLVHLCLPCRMAPLNVVLFYMNTILDGLQKKTAGQDHNLQQLQHEVHNHVRRIEQLDGENSKIRESMVENVKNLNQRHTEEIQHIQESLRKASEQRHNDNERNRKTISALQMQLEKISVEKGNLQAEKIHDHKRNETLSEELASMKTHISNLKEQNEKLHAEIASLKNLERKNEMHLGDTRKHIGDLQDKLKKYDKAKADLIAELEAEKKITQNKRHALEMATEEISKANEIILKQSQDLIRLKKTVSWRTDVALHQEKAMNEKEKVLRMREDEIKHLQSTIESLRQEIPQQLDSLRMFANTLEQKYSEQIQVLRDKLNTTKDPLCATTPANSRRK